MTVARLGGVALSANSAITWNLQTGVIPYITRFTVHHSQVGAMNEMLGRGQDLYIDSLNGRITIHDVTPLYRVASDSPNRATYIIADQRWRWAYPLVAKDYNVIRKTGDVTLAKDQEIGNPASDETRPLNVEIEYLPYSLRNESERWSAREMLEDVLEVVDPGNWSIRSLPFGAEQAGDESAMSVQNLFMRDSGHHAVARALAYIPGAQVYIETSGRAVVFDATDLEEAFAELEAVQGDISTLGDYPCISDRTRIRPSRVFVYVAREMEVRLDNIDEGVAISDTEANQFNVDRALGMDNVAMAVDPEVNAPNKSEPIRLGEWHRVKDLLDAWEAGRDAATVPSPYDFETIHYHYPHGKLNERWGAQGALDILPEANIQARVSTIVQHYRRTFRIDQNLMRRVREVKACRSGLINPVDGTRSPAMVWGQYCINPTHKGWNIAARKDKALAGRYINVDHYPGKGGRVNVTPASPAHVSILDGHLGVINISYADSMYGTWTSRFPSMLLNDKTNAEAVPTADLENQDDDPISLGGKVEGSATLVLAPEFKMCCILSIIPNSPNGLDQFYRVRVESSRLKRYYPTSIGLETGEGPDLHLFIPPTMLTSRWRWDDPRARESLSDLLGLDGKGGDPTLAGAARIPGMSNVNGYEVRDVAYAYAAEQMLKYANAPSGAVVGGPSDPLMRAGMDTVSHSVSASPGGAYRTARSFVGQQPPIDRFALTDMYTRHMVLGVIKYRDDR